MYYQTLNIDHSNYFYINHLILKIYVMISICFILLIYLHIIFPIQFYLIILLYLIQFFFILIDDFFCHKILRHLIFLTLYFYPFFHYLLILYQNHFLCSIYYCIQAILLFFNANLNVNFKNLFFQKSSFVFYFHMDSIFLFLYSICYHYSLIVHLFHSLKFHF